MKKIIALVALFAFTAAFVSAPANAECTGDETMKVKCKKGTLKVKIKGGEGGALATINVDGAAAGEITLKSNGKGKTKIKGLEDGDHVVDYVECGVSADVNCKGKKK